MDGDMDLGFKVTLETAAIWYMARSLDWLRIRPRQSLVILRRNTAGTGMGTWSGQFYGPNADDDADSRCSKHYTPKWSCRRVRCQVRSYECCRCIRGGKDNN